MDMVGGKIILEGEIKNYLVGLVILGGGYEGVDSVREFYSTNFAHSIIFFFSLHFLLLSLLTRKFI